MSPEKELISSMNGRRPARTVDYILLTLSTFLLFFHAFAIIYLTSPDVPVADTLIETPTIGIVLLVGTIYTICVILHIKRLQKTHLLSCRAVLRTLQSVEEASPDSEQGEHAQHIQGYNGEAGTSQSGRYNIVALLCAVATTSMLLDVNLIWWFGLSQSVGLSRRIHTVDNSVARVFSTTGLGVLYVMYLLTYGLLVSLVFMPAIRLVMLGVEGRVRWLLWVLRACSVVPLEPR